MSVGSSRCASCVRWVNDKKSPMSSTMVPAAVTTNRGLVASERRVWRSAPIGKEPVNVMIRIAITRPRICSFTMLCTAVLLVTTIIMKPLPANRSPMEP